MGGNETSKCVGGAAGGIVGGVIVKGAVASAV